MQNVQNNESESEFYWHCRRKKKRRGPKRPQLEHTICTYSILKYAVLNCILCQWGGSTQADCCGFGSLVLHCQCPPGVQLQYIPCQVCTFYMCSTFSAKCASFICEVCREGIQLLSNVQCPVQKLIELWFCVLIDTLLYSLHCVMQRLTVLCTAMHHLLTV